MYNYAKPLPEGFSIEDEISKGSSAKVFILIDKNGNKIVRKISDIEGINKNGKEKLKKEIIFLEYFNDTRNYNLYPKIYNFEFNNKYVYYDMSYIEGKTLQELLDENKIDESIECCNKVINDLCIYSDIKRLDSQNEKILLYEKNIGKTKNTINKLSDIEEISDIINTNEIVINNKIYKNVKTIIEFLNDKEIQNKLISNSVAFCFHGDLISSNIIYNNGEIGYIDPRGSLSDFDICYDIAKLKFSFSGYNQIDNGKFIVYNLKNSIYFEIESNANTDINTKFFTLLKKNIIFSNNVIKQDGYWEERIKMYTALQYINNSYVQIKNGNIDKFKIMYAIGTIALNELLREMH